MKTRLCSGRQRARSEADKAAREQQILDAGETLFLRHHFHQLTLADVARAAGLTKAALYRYFRSKELLFIAVYRRAMVALVEDAAQIQPVAFADQLTALLVAHPTYCGLTAILHIALETGLTEAEARDFKLFLLKKTEHLTELAEVATGRNQEACFHYLMQCQQALIGCWHMSHPPEAAAKAMQQPPLTIFQMDFADTLTRHLRMLTDTFIRERPE